MTARSLRRLSSGRSCTPNGGAVWLKPRRVTSTRQDWLTDKICSVATADQLATSISTLLEEYKALRAEILARLDLQHKNMNVLVVLVSAITGFLVKYAGEHGVSGHGATLVNNQIVTLVPLAALSINVFLWRHADHDVGIIDAACYLEQRLRPAIVDGLGPGQYLGYEAFLSEHRRGRSRDANRLVSLGNENVTMFLLLAFFLAAGWCVHLTSTGSAGNAHGVFNVLLYLASALTVFSLAISFIVGANYLRILPSPGAIKPPSVDNAAPAALANEVGPGSGTESSDIRDEPTDTPPPNTPVAP